MALEDYFEDFNIQSKVYVDTGFGTFEPQYTDGANFRAGISTNSSVEAQIAERNGMKTIYTIVHGMQFDARVSSFTEREEFGKTTLSVVLGSPDQNAIKGGILLYG